MRDPIPRRAVEVAIRNAIIELNNCVP